MNRRDWIRNTALGGGAALLGGVNGLYALTAKERATFHPRPLEDVIKLSSNENPYGPSEAVRNAVQESFSIACRYPYRYADELAEMLAAKEGVTREQIIITGGSTEALKACGVTFAANGGEIIAGKPTFLAMMTYASQWGSKVNWVPLNDALEYDMPAINNAITDKTSLVFLCNPNNPTSTLLPKDVLLEYSEAIAQKTILFSDEAYYDFIEDPEYPSLVAMVKEGKQVIVSRTFSKVYGMAGMRIGYLVTTQKLAKKIRDKVMAYSNVPAIQGAKAALSDKAFYQFSLKKNKEARQMICATLDQLELEYLPSQTNFVFFHSGRPIHELHRAMLEQGVQIGRPFPPFTDWCRISTGTAEEVTAFTKALKKVYT
ncbi:pyridoxal phosphate-dependent aminotransferase [Robertkochia sediminum]|uniref:pyridoxal phosphate-dependent aminotransferase n=1 Tax=Robertkochia sediminum TaxID=2785326 RepID=UPI001F212017|nr:histidinol-phosphate transaminase [Robertkochia sediminum]MBL7472611.1 histidinol-phosphate aminotransferase family protein [Robertkochia sediminum]